VAPLRSANEVADTIIAGQPKGWTTLAEPCARPTPAQPCRHIRDRAPNCETRRIETSTQCREAVTPKTSSSLTRFRRRLVDSTTPENRTQGLTPAKPFLTHAVLGQEVDSIARTRLRLYLTREGISEGHGTSVLVNRRLNDPSGSGKYRVPDVRLEDSRLIMDGTIGGKTPNSPQVRDFRIFSGGYQVRIIRPGKGA
jgi:hypothetical protein